MKAISGVCWCWLMLVPAVDAALPELVVPQGVGVNIHFTRGHERDLDLIADAGFKVVRMDFGWEGIERRRGEYDWSAYDELTSNLERRGLRPLYILDYSNPLYEETVASRNPITGQEQRATASPQRPESVAAFARWAGAAAARYRGRGVIWEIWNEPNISFWKPKPEVAQYVALARATCRAVREADPMAVIVAPATSEFPWAFLEAFLESGILAELDAVSVHPYRSYAKGPETAAEDYRRLRALIARHTRAGEVPVPMLSGEWGYASHTKGVTREIQAAFLVRQQLANLLEGVPISIWYDWKDDGTDPAEREHNFGTVTHDLALKPAYVALRTMTRELAGFRVARRLAVGSDQDYLLLLVNDRKEGRIAAWTAGDPHTLPVTLKGRFPPAIRRVTGIGETAEIRVEAGRLELELGRLPQYVHVGGAEALP